MLSSQQSRRTKQQKKQDEARAKAAAVAARDQAKADERAILTRIAHLEDSIESGEQLVRASSQRPDLHCVQPTEEQDLTATGYVSGSLSSITEQLTTGNNGRHLENSDSNDTTNHWDKENHRIMTPPKSSELRDSSSDSDFEAASSDEESDLGSESESVQVESEDAMSVMVESSDIGRAATKRNLNTVSAHWLQLVRWCSPSFTESNEGPGLPES